MANNYSCDEKVIVGKTVKSVENADDETLLFEFTDGSICQFYHSQDCCESVYITECGNLTVLENATITDFDSYEVAGEDGYNSTTTTTLSFRSSKGLVKVIWLGMSNGYYSESVDFRYYPAN